MRTAYSSENANCTTEQTSLEYHWAQSLIAVWPISIRTEMLTPAQCFLSPCKKWKRLKDRFWGQKWQTVVFLWKKLRVLPIPHLPLVGVCWLRFSWSYVSSAFSLGYMSLCVVKFLNCKSSISLPSSFSLKCLKLIWEYFLLSDVLHASFGELCYSSFSCYVRVISRSCYWFVAGYNV